MIEALKAHAVGHIEKHKVNVEVILQKAVGIGDHSTEDFYKNAEEALIKLVDADDRIGTLQTYFDGKTVL